MAVQLEKEGLKSTDGSAIQLRDNTTLSGQASINSGATVTIESSNSNGNLLEFKTSSDNGVWEGLIFTDNNQGGYVVHGNAGNYDGLRIGSYNTGMKLDVSTNNTTSGVAIKTQCAFFDDANTNRFCQSGAQARIGENRSGTFLAFNDDMWFSDTQKGQIQLRNWADTGYGTIVGILSNQSSRHDKKNIEPLTDAQLDTVAETLRGIDVNLWQWNDEPDNSSTRHIGPIAQDMPSYVAGLQDKTSINSAYMDGFLMAALKSALNKIEQLEGRIAALETA
jgi:hypothetical protein